MCPEHCRRIRDRVEADRDEVHAPERRVGLQRYLQGGEMTIHQRTERRQWTLGVDEGHHDGSALETGEAAFLAALIDEAAVRYGFARLEQLES